MVEINPLVGAPVGTPDAWTKTPTYEQVSSEICQSEVPKDLCQWTEFRWRFFHVSDIALKRFSGEIEITFKNPTTGELWECHNGKYTAEAEATAWY